MMSETPNKSVQYASDPHLSTIKDKDWINVARFQNRKRNVNESDSDSSVSQETRRFKKTCCTTETLNDTINLFRDEMKAMHSLLSIMKEEQDTKYAQMQTDLNEIKKEVIELKTENFDYDRTLKNIESKCQELDESHRKITESSNKNEKRIQDFIQKNIFLEKYNKSLEDRIGWLEQKELARNVELINVQQMEGENIVEVIEKIARELQLNEKDIEKCGE